MIYYSNHVIGRTLTMRAGLIHVADVRACDANTVCELVKSNNYTKNTHH